MATTIVAGDVTDEARKWLEQHGAKIEGFGLLIITLPEQALIHKGSYGWDYSIAFYNAEGNDEESYADIELNIDAYSTRIRVEYNGDRQCSCKGKGCAKCVEELAAIARGENPYAHHRPTFKVGDQVAIVSGYYKDQEATVAGKAYEDPSDRELVCLVQLKGDSGPATVVAIAEIKAKA